MIAICCSAGAKTGFGHLARCRTLASNLKEKSIDTVMVGVAEKFKNDTDGTLFHSWIEFDFNLDPNILFQRFHQLVTAFGLRGVILDSYDISQKFERLLTEENISCMKFFNSMSPESYTDLVVNPFPSSNQLASNKYLLNEKTIELKGPKYAILREEFTKVRSSRSFRDVKNLLITFGGGDDRGANEFVIKSLLESLPSEINLHVLSGKNNPNNDRLQNLTSERVFLHINPEKVAQLFIECDLAIISGGTSTYELASLGVPMILIGIVDNQKSQAREWANVGAALYLGQLNEVNPDEITHSVLDLMQDQEKRKKMSDIGYALVDGLGASRVIEKFIGVMENE